MKERPRWLRELDELRKTKVWQVLRYLARGVLIYAYFALVYAIAGEMLQGMGELNLQNVFTENGQLKVDMVNIPFALPGTLLILPFLFYSVARTVTMADRSAYFATEATDGNVYRVRMGAVLSSWAYVLEMVAIAALYVLFPLPSGFDAVRRATALIEVGLDVEKVLYGCVLLPLFALLLACANLSARRDWQVLRATAEQRKSATPVWHRRGLIAALKDKVGFVGMLAGMFLILVVYTVGVYAAMILITIAVPFAVIVAQKPILIFAALGFFVGLFLLIAGPSYLRALRVRAKTLRRLRRICREKGYVISNEKHLYSSLMFAHKGANFTLTVGECTYDCRLLASVMPGGRMAFFPEGKVEIRHHIRFFNLQGAPGMAAAQNFETPTFTTKRNYAFESEREKLLILCPVATQTFLIEGPRVSALDTGDCIGERNEYQIYNSTGFLGALDRDHLGKR